ncbi:hypothetical protein Nepgr_000988 [Nepenthes gracilis]|uniref:Uncharacterized protein n=1 Tax=Nepenthes gracilis TaxID=150966 RepID=A0AAD3RWL9_NEPGR|nr:hypothetical protein Nepgr_000988 [Nepenthes gracilis]
MPRSLHMEMHSEKGKESRGMDNRERRLYDAALEGDVDLLLELLREDPLILHRYEVSEANSVSSPLHVVAKLGHVRFATEILSRKPELEEELNPSKSSPLHLASGKGHLEIVKCYGSYCG